MADKLGRDDSTYCLPLPAWLRPGEDRQGVVGQAIEVDQDWWNKSLAAFSGFEQEAPHDRDVLTRADLFALGREASSSVAAARRLLWATLS